MKKMSLVILILMFGLLFNGCSDSPLNDGASNQRDPTQSAEPVESLNESNNSKAPLASKEPAVDLSSIPEAPASDFKYRILSTGKVEILKYLGDSVEVGVPTKIEGCPVTKIGNRAFEKLANIKGIRIPNGVTEIGDYAFKGCTSLRSVNIPSSVVKINIGAFSECASLTDIAISEGLTQIAGGVFDYCTALTSIKVSEENQSFCDIDGVMFSKDGSTLVFYPVGRGESRYAIPERVTEIRVNAFSTCENLTDITIPKSVTTLGDFSFSKCKSLTGVVIPQSTKNMNKGIFSDCANLREVTLPSGMAKIPTGMFANCTSLTDLVLPDSVTEIWTQGFRNCTSLTALALPDGMTHISKDSFEGCEKLVVTFRGVQYTYADKFASLYSTINGGLPS